MVEPVHITVQGRARFKVEGLYRSAELKRQLEEELSRDAGVRRVSASCLTGNVLVLYNSGRGPSDILGLLKTVVNGGRKPEGKNFSGTQVPRKKPSARVRPGDSAKTIPPPVVAVCPDRTAVVPATASLWHVRKSSDILVAFSSDAEIGLTEESYAENVKRFGPNLLPESAPRSAWSMFVDQFKSIPVLLLGIAAGVSLLTGGIADAAVIAGVVAVNAAIGFITESRSEKTIRSLKTLVRPHALVKRAGEIRQIGVGNVVPGDVLVLRPGTYVAGDARLLTARNLSVDESALTGESIPAHKAADELSSVAVPLAERTNMVFMGTLVTGGQGEAVVVATASRTEMGQIQILVGEARPPATPMEIQLERMGTRLALLSAAVCAGVFVIGLLRGYGFLRMLKSSISLAVAAVPEGLPAVATTTLSIGIARMRKHNVLVRRLGAIETLGSVQTICMDKTGTITLNRMTVTQIVAGMERMTVADGRYTLGNGDVNPYLTEELLMLLHISVLCNESEVFGSSGSYTVTGSPTENALIHMALASGIAVEELRHSFPRTGIIHRSETRNIMVTVHDANNAARRVIAVKGSPPEVLAECRWVQRAGLRLELSDEIREEIQAANEEMAGRGLRVLGMAFALSDEKPAVAENGDIVIGDLVWIGTTGMTDPVRSGVGDLVGAFHSAGIDTVMITGDQSGTAYAIAKELDLAGGDDIRILDSRHLADMSPDVLGTLSTNLHVFARVSPAHKLQIVRVLQHSGKVVAMTGDGVNDAPALRAAAIGVAMGHTGTDVAREVADIVLEDDNLQTMLVAISEGRTTYNNIRKSLHFLLSTNMSEVMVTAASMTVGLGEPLTAMQLLWINLVTDIFPGLALALEPPEPDVLLRPPRDHEEEILQPAALKKTLREAALLSAGSLGAYSFGVARYGQGPQAGTMAFLSLTAGQLLHALSCRSEEKTVFDAGVRPNPYLKAALLGTFGLQALALVFPPVRSLLGIARIGAVDGLIVGAGAILPLLANEGVKKMSRKAL